MSKQRRRTSNINDLLKRKGSLLSSDSSINILEQIENVTGKRVEESKSEKSVKKAIEKDVETSVSRKETVARTGRVKKSSQSSGQEHSKKARSGAVIDSTGDVDSKIVMDVVDSVTPGLLDKYMMVLDRVGASNAMHYFILKEHAIGGLLKMSLPSIAFCLRVKENAARSAMKTLKETNCLEVVEEKTSKTPRVYNMLV